MPRTNIQSRLNHLERSAYLLALGEPQTSAYLQAEHTRLLRENDISPSKDRVKEVCGRCGTIMLPGLTAKIRKGENKIDVSCDKPGIQSTRVSRRLAGRRAHICLRCSSVTKYSVIDGSCHTLPMVKGLPELPDEKKTAATPDVQRRDQRKKHDSIVRKKSSRSRVRAKGKGSLQEMLTKSKRGVATVSQQTGFGFDLMDFVKKSQ